MNYVRHLGTYIRITATPGYMGHIAKCYYLHIQKRTIFCNGWLRRAKLRNGLCLYAYIHKHNGTT
jgi:hypothetical protein